jgi:hypothetical protein
LDFLLFNIICIRIFWIDFSSVSNIRFRGEGGVVVEITKIPQNQRKSSNFHNNKRGGLIEKAFTLQYQGGIISWR